MMRPQSPAAVNHKTAAAAVLSQQGIRDSMVLRDFCAGTLQRCKTSQLCTVIDEGTCLWQLLKIELMQSALWSPPLS
jgi:hypothetical protein